MTKAYLLLLGAVLCAGSLSAAPKAKRPHRGSFSTEVQFNPFNQDNSTTVGGLERLKLRWFITDKNALRLRLGFGFDSNKYTPNNNDASDTWGRARKGDLNLDLGWEHHWHVGSRASIYAGLQGGVVRHFASGKYNLGDGDSYTYKNAVPKDWTNKGDFTKGYADRANVGWTAGTFAGVDVYLYRGLYLGTEVSVDAESRRSLTVELNQNFDHNNGSSQFFKTSDRERTTSLKYHVQPGIRLGWTF